MIRPSGQDSPANGEMQGGMKVTANTTLSSYKEVDGLKSAMKIVQELVGLGMTQEIEFESIKYNAPIEDAVFELPAAIKELANEAEAEEDAKDAE